MMRGQMLLVLLKWTRPLCLALLLLLLLLLRLLLPL